MTSRAPRVGVFDSGVGGISVLRELRAAAPWIDLIYVADQGYCPYGDRPDHEIVGRAVAIADFLLEESVDAVVVACNTATVAAVEGLRRRYSIPIVGTEPPVKPAAALSATGTVGVLATSGTLAGRKFTRLIEDHADGVRVLTQPCPGLADLVETGDLEGPETRRLLARFIDPLLEGGADVIVLGSTHYVFLRALVAEIAGEHVRVLDPVQGVVRRTVGLVAGESPPPGVVAGPIGWHTTSPTGDAAVVARLMETDGVDLIFRPL